MSVAMWIIWLFQMGSHYIHSSANQWSAVTGSFTWRVHHLTVLKRLSLQTFISQSVICCKWQFQMVGTLVVEASSVKLWTHFEFDSCFTEVFSMKDQWNPQNRAHFPEMINLRGHMPRITLRMNIFPSILLENPINVCWNPQNKAWFSKTINLKGHMPRFTIKMNVFSIYLLGNPINVCWNSQNRVSFSEMINLRGHMPRFTLKINIFPSISLQTP